MVSIKSIFQRFFPYGIFRTGQKVYLTFDDGPIPEVTPAVLDILAKYRVKATFFMVGENIDKYPEVYEQVAKAGHCIGNHTYNHLKGWRVSTAEYIANVRKWEEVCDKQIVNRKSSNRKWFRPPYGRTWLCQRRAIARLGYRIIFWDILTRDYEASRTPEQMLAQIKKETRPGSIINFHDSLKSNERMLTVLPQAIEWLQEQGYELAALE